jgi:predicted nuclease with RNAse H fold
MSSTLDAVSVFSLAGLGRWLRRCDEVIAEKGARLVPEVIETRERVLAELRRRGVEV